MSFLQALKRPQNFVKLHPEVQWDIDKSLGILDWDGTELNKAHEYILNQYFKKGKSIRDIVYEQILKRPPEYFVLSTDAQIKIDTDLGIIELVRDINFTDKQLEEICWYFNIDPCEKCTKSKINVFGKPLCISCDSQEVVQSIHKFNQGRIPGVFPFDKDGIVLPGVVASQKKKIPDDLQRYPYRPSLPMAKFVATGNNGGDCLEIELIHSDKLSNDSIHISIAQSCVYQYKATMPVSVLIAFVLKHLHDNKDDICSVFENEDFAHFKDLASKVRIGDVIPVVESDDIRLVQEGQYTITEPECIVQLWYDTPPEKKERSESDVNVRLIGWIDEDQISPYMTDYISEELQNEKETFLAPKYKEGVYILKIVAHTSYRFDDDDECYIEIIKSKKIK